MLTVPATTLRNWAVGYSVKRADGRQIVARPLVTTAARRPGSRAIVPFVGLAEAYTLLAFKAAGVPVQRIRPAITWLEEHLGLMQALASERLILCEDLAIARNEIEAETVFRCDARVFGVANANITGPDIAARFLAYEEQIVRMAMRAHGPFVVSISARGLRRVPVEPRLPVARR